MTATRCPAAHPADSSPCSGPVVVMVLDAGNAGARGCEHHAARLLASLSGGRVYGLPDAPAGAAIRVFKASGSIRPFCWLAEGLAGASAAAGTFGGLFGRERARHGP